MDLPRPPLARRPVIAERPHRLFGLAVDHRVVGQQVRQMRYHAIEQALAVGRVEKEYIEALRWLGGEF